MKIVGQSFVDGYEMFVHSTYVSAYATPVDGLQFFLSTFGILIAMLVAVLISVYLYQNYQSKRIEQIVQ